MSEATSDSPEINRRSLLLGGAGAAALTATGLTGVHAAAAGTPAARAGDGVTRHPHGSPVTNTIASAPISQYTYRSVCMYDFEPFNPAAQKTWGGFGVYSAGTSTAMRATIEIPAGVLLQDVEYYVYNDGGSDIAADSWLYVPGQGTITSLTATGTVPSTGAISAVRALVPSSSAGPYPSGSRLLVGASTPSNGTVQINGARVGFLHGAGEVGLLRVPVRVYDSRHSAKFKAGQTRTVTLPKSVFNPGATGVTVNVVAFSGSAAGTVKVWAADGTEPAGAALYFGAGGHLIANMITTGITAHGQLKIKCSEPTHVVIDVSATVA